jgi:uncharacterized membrane protein
MTAASYKWQKISLILMSVFYMAAGFNHFWHAAFYLDLMPAYIPYHLPLVYISGVCELLPGGLLLFASTRKAAAWLIILMLIAFLPVHVDMIVKTRAAMGLLFWVAVMRLPLQFVLMRWAYGLKDFKLNAFKTNT